MNLRKLKKVKSGFLSFTFFIGITAPLIAFTSQNRLITNNQNNNLVQAINYEVAESTFTMNASQMATYLNNHTFNLSDQNRVRISAWSNLSSSELAVKLNTEVFANYYFRIDPEIATYYIVDQVEDNEGLPGYLKLKVNLADVKTRALFSTYFYVSNFLNNNEKTINFDANKFANINDLYLDPSKMTSQEVLLPNVGQIIGTGIRNEDIDGKSSYSWTGPIRREWRFLPYNENKDITLPVETMDVFRTYTVNKVNYQTGSIEVKLELKKNQNTKNIYFNIHGFLTRKEQAKKLLDKQIFILNNPELIWKDSNLKTKFETSVFTNGLFPSFDNLPITYQIKEENTKEGFIIIEAFWNEELLASFEVNNFKTSDQTILESIISTYESNYILDTKLPFPEVNLNEVIDDFVFANNQVLPNQFPFLNYQYQSILIDNIHGQMLVKVTIWNANLSKDAYFTISNFKTSSESIAENNYQLLLDIEKTLSNQVFSLLTPEKLWNQDTNLAFMLNHSIFNNQQFPQFFTHVEDYIDYEIASFDEAKGILRIKTTITIDQNTKTIYFEVTNFKINDQLLVEKGIEALNSNYHLQNKQAFPDEEANLNNLIDNFVFDDNQILPWALTNLTYDYQNVMIDNIHGQMLVKVTISKNDFSQVAYFTINNFEDNSNQYLKDALNKSYESLNNHIFSLKPEEKLIDKLDLWANLDSKEIYQKLNQDIFDSTFDKPSFNQILKYQFKILQTNWDLGKLLLEATITSEGYKPQIAIFTIDNFKTNADIINIAFEKEIAKLANIKLINKNQSNKNSIFLTNDLVLELPSSTTYQTHSTDGREIYNHVIKRDYFVSFDNSHHLIDIDFHLVDHENKMFLVDLHFDNIEEEKNRFSVLWLALGVPLGITIFTLILYLSRKQYYRHKFKKEK